MKILAAVAFFLPGWAKDLSACQSQWPRGLRRSSAAARLLRFWVRIPPGERMSVCSECCVLSGRGLCDELITRPEESYRLCCAGCVWSRNLVNEETIARVGLQHQKKKKNILFQQLHLKYLCNLTMYWSQAPWWWHDSAETCSSVIICEIIVHLLVIVQNNKS